jgi:hypothetical protein
MTLTKQLALCCSVVVALVFAGCGASENEAAATFPVTGKVTVGGEPLPSGRIFFEDPAKGISNGADITNGAYSGNAAAGDLKAKVVTVETTKDPMGNESQTEKILQLDIPVVIKNGGGEIPPIDVPASK